jgi:serine/threonine protein kinase
VSAADRRRPPSDATPARSAPDNEEGLLTAEDLFGDLVDAPPDPRVPTPRRRGPVRVRLADAASDAKLAFDALEAGSSPTPVLAEPPPAQEPEPPAVAPAAEVVPPLKLPVRPRSGSPADADFDEDLGAPLSAPGPDGERVPARFQAAPPKPMAATGGSLDLQAVAEGAMKDGPPPAPARVPSWREDRYGPYQLLERVAVGGMAEVFKAKRSGVEGFEKVVAVKRILPHLSDNKEFVDMFVDEAKMVASLSHPNIVQIFDLGRIDRSYYIAMEYVHGRDLRTILRRAREKGLRLPMDLALRIGRAVAGALDYAHRRRDERGRPIEIVHRDVSPQNILLSFEGDVKLADFGIAKAATKASGTDRGALRGKLLYMSPEQAWGRAIDQRSDLFSLGIVLYEMVTDERPFQPAGTDMGTLELVRECHIRPPREVSPRVTEDVDRVIVKALSRKPEDRFQTAAEMDRALERVLRGRNAPTGHELARYLEVLFDREEREEPLPPADVRAPDASTQGVEEIFKRLGIE